MGSLKDEEFEGLALIINFVSIIATRAFLSSCSECAARAIATNCACLEREIATRPLKDESTPWYRVDPQRKAPTKTGRPSLTRDYKVKAHLSVGCSLAPTFFLPRSKD